MNKKIYLNKNFIIQLYNFTKSEFIKDETKTIRKIKKKFNKKIILRSSSFNEDTNMFTNAGLYKSYVVKTTTQELKKKYIK